ncbi:MAG TPA: prepilin-type N-terminal cleavage/methylation domain-containing protein [Tepidisphaeraceae bacterium]|nr:prepilin-type N-terminal cleavage/methylation domain-containing protein [Tepidisphaeraceae bacterium]
MDTAHSISRPKAGFTLVELLVVVGIIAVLMAILMPVMTAAREASKTVACLSNLRQMATAAHCYALANQGSYPIAYYVRASGSTTTWYAWDFTTIKDFGSGTPTETVTAGLLWQGQGSGKVQQCPSFEGASNTKADPFTGYNYNTSYIGHGANETVIRPAKVTDVKRPTQCALFGDGQYRDGANKFMRAPWASEGDMSFMARSAGTQGYRHRGKTNVVFCDGHAETLGQRYTSTYAGEQANIVAGTGFLSPDNSLYALK